MSGAPDVFADTTVTGWPDTHDVTDQPDKLGEVVFTDAPPASLGRSKKIWPALLAENCIFEI
jgi:hypothetical protein